MAVLKEARLETGRHERNMGFKWWTKFKGARFTSEVPEPDQRPMLPPIFGYGQLVARNVEGCSFPTIGRLDLDESVTTVGFKTENIVARAIAIHVGDPTDAFG